MEGTSWGLPPSPLSYLSLYYDAIKKAISQRYAEFPLGEIIALQELLEHNRSYYYILPIMEKGRK